MPRISRSASLAVHFPKPKVEILRVELSGPILIVYNNETKSTTPKMDPIPFASYRDESRRHALPTNYLQYALKYTSRLAPSGALRGLTWFAIRSSIYITGGSADANKALLKYATCDPLYGEVQFGDRTYEHWGILYTDWAANFLISYDANILERETLKNLLALAGRKIGIGMPVVPSRRPGEINMFEVREY